MSSTHDKFLRAAPSFPEKQAESTGLLSVGREAADVMMDAMFPSARNQTVERGIIQLDVLYGTKQSRSTGHFEANFSLWAYTDGMNDQDMFMSRESIGWCPRDGCPGHQKADAKLRGHGAFTCSVCGLMCPEHALSEFSFHRFDKRGIADFATQAWFDFEGPADILAVIHKARNLRHLQNEGIYGGHNRGHYREAVDRARVREVVRYSHRRILQDLSAGSTVQARLLAFLRTL